MRLLKHFLFGVLGAGIGFLVGIPGAFLVALIFAELVFLLSLEDQMNGFPLGLVAATFVPPILSFLGFLVGIEISCRMTKSTQAKSSSVKDLESDVKE